MNLKSNEKSIQYEVYAPGQSQKLDLSVCSKTKIDVLYPIQLDEETKTIYEDLKSQGYDLFDKNNRFYKDICTPYKSEDGTDVILADRNNDFFAKHEIICQANCDYSSFSSQSNFVRCECNVVENEKMEAEEPIRVTSKGDVNSFIDILKYSNYKVLYCYKLVFRGVTFYKNLGSIFTMLYFIGYCISFGFFCYYGLTPFKLELAKLFKKKRDIRNLKINNINDSVNTNTNLTKDKKINIISNAKLKELIDSDTKRDNNQDINNNQNNNNNNQSSNTNTMSLFKSKDPVDSNAANNNTNTKGNLKRTLKNKKTHFADDKLAKENDKKERDVNITYTKEHINKNIAIKNYKDHAFNTKISKGEFPPKRSSNSNNNNIDLDNKSIKSDANSANIFANDIVIHKTKNSRKDLLTKDVKSYTKEELLAKDEQKVNIELIEEKEENKKEEISKKKDNIILTDYELNHLEYNEALNLDDRIFLKIYWSLLKREHPIVYTFFAWDDFNLFFTKLSKFFFLVTTIMAFDALFFSNDAMHEIYVSGGSYSFGNHIVQMILTIIIYEPLQILLNYLTFTDIDYYKIKAKKNTITQKEIISIIKCIKYKFIGFYIFTFLVFLFYWYLNSAFCAVYEYTQKFFVADSFICLIFALIYDLALYLAPTGLRKISFIFQKTKVMNIIYKISQWIPVF